MTRSIHVDEVIDQLAISSPLKKKKNGNSLSDEKSITIQKDLPRA